MPALLELLTAAALPSVTGVAAGSILSAQVTVRNTGNGPGKWTITGRLINRRDGSPVLGMGSAQVALLPGESKSLSFSSPPLPYAWEVEPDIDWLLAGNNVVLDCEWTATGSSTASRIDANVVTLDKGTPNLVIESVSYGTAG